MAPVQPRARFVAAASNRFCADSVPIVVLRLARHDFTAAMVFTVLEVCRAPLVDVAFAPEVFALSAEPVEPAPR